MIDIETGDHGDHRRTSPHRVRPRLVALVTFHPRPAIGAPTPSPRR